MFSIGICKSIVNGFAREIGVFMCEIRYVKDSTWHKKRTFRPCSWWTGRIACAHHKWLSVYLRLRILIIWKCHASGFIHTLPVQRIA